MQIYFLRHGIAFDRAPDGTDRSRALTPEGISHMEQEAAGLKQLGVSVDLLLTSPFVRARQTAEIVGPLLGREPQIEPALSSGMTPQALIAVLEQQQAQSVMVVGHEPDLSEAISFLIGGGMIAMKKGGLALVELWPGTPRGVLHWLLAPKILRALRKG